MKTEKAADGGETKRRKVWLLWLLLPIACAGAILFYLFTGVGPEAFVLRDTQDGSKVYGSPLTVVIQTCRGPADRVPARAEVLKPDLFGRYTPVPALSGQVAEFYVWHVAYRPLARVVPAGGELSLEPHGGEPSPEIEAELRGLGEREALVAAALKKAFLRPGEVRRSIPGSHPPAVALGDSGRVPAPAAAAPALPVVPLSKEERDRREAAEREADEVAAAIAQCLKSRSPGEPQPALDRIDAFLARAPKDVRLSGSRALEHAVARGLDAPADPTLTPRLIALAGALWHGTALSPAAFTGLSRSLAEQPPELRAAFAEACARIGGQAAARELAFLVRWGFVPPAGAWVAIARKAGSSEVLAKVLEEARSEATLGDFEDSRLAKALAALSEEEGLAPPR